MAKSLNFYLILYLLISPYTFGASSLTPLTVRMVILSPVCKITGKNNEDIISIDFGRIDYNKISDNYKSTPINYSISCDTSYVVKMNIKLSGENSSFGENLLKTSNQDIAIKIMAKGEKFPINSSTSFSWPLIPELKAVITKNNTSNPVAGPFTAWAVMTIYYD